MHGPYLLGTHDECDLRRRDHAFHQIIHVKARACVFDANATVSGVRVYRPSVAVAVDDDVADGVMEACTTGLEG